MGLLIAAAAVLGKRAKVKKGQMFKIVMLLAILILIIAAIFIFKVYKRIL